MNILGEYFLEEKIEVMVADLQPKENEWIVVKYNPYEMPVSVIKNYMDYLGKKFGEHVIAVPNDLEIMKGDKDKYIKAFENILEWLKNE